MTDDKTSGESQEQTARERFAQLSPEQQAELLGKDKVTALSEEEITARLSGLDSGDTLGHEELMAGMVNELSAQTKVIDLLSAQTEDASLNIAKVLDSKSVDLAFLMAVQVKEPTRDIIGPNATAERRQHIQEQISLPTSAAFKMCWRSVLIRLGRVMITASGIFLGIAFFASVRMTAMALNAAGEASEVEDAARNYWLIVLALLVSVVGICNSMLMAVTERYQEIGTMKCLGALDGFIVKLFLIESGLLGALAGLLGSVVGLGLMYLLNALKYTFKFSDVVGGIGMTILISMVLGTVLSILAAILPARHAARMPAAAALRTTV